MMISHFSFLVTLFTHTPMPRTHYTQVDIPIYLFTPCALCRLGITKIQKGIMHKAGMSRLSTCHTQRYVEPM